MNEVTAMELPRQRVTAKDLPAGDVLLIERKEHLQDEGVWRDLEVDGAVVGQVKVATVGQMAYAKKLEKHRERYKRRHRIKRSAELNPVQELECQIATLDDVCLKGWRGLTSGGEPLDFTSENRKRVLSLRTFRAAITDLALDLSEQSLEELEDDEKNSASTFDAS